jgi:prephenate dehydrogenase
MFNRITIIGLGLIGGSLGLAIKEKRLAKEVVGVSRRRTTLKRALTIGAVDTVTLDLKKGVKGSDIVILTTPVLKIIEIAKQISKDLYRGTILIDAGSTKKHIVNSVERFLPDGVYFVGSHPLAGSEKSGISYASKDLFKGAHCILTKTRRTNPKALATIKKFWTALSMKIKIMNPEEHDRLLSRLSHLPHASSVALCNTVGTKKLRFAGGGLKDTTRIASSSPELWLDIFITNRKNIAREIEKFKTELSKIEIALGNDNGAALLRLLEKAKKVRDSI